MLILTRKPGESVYIGGEVKVTVVEVKGNQIRLGVEAPPHIRIYREEIWLQILEENKKAADIGEEESLESGLEGLVAAWKGRPGPERKVKPLSAGLAPKPGTGASAPKTSEAVPSVVMRRKGKREEPTDD